MPYEVDPKAFEAAIAEAEKKGLEPVRGDEYTLLVDLDGPEAQRRFADTLPRLTVAFGLWVRERWPSRSGEPGHEHVVLDCEPEQPPLARLALQAR